MKRMEFIPPEGDPVVDPTLEVLQRAILDTDDSWWNRGSRDGGLHLIDGKYKGQLVLVFHPGRGFCVVFESSQEKTPKVLSTRPEAMTMIEVDECGNLIRVPEAYFVGRQDAWSAMQEFWKTGMRSEAGIWLEYSPVLV